MHLVEVLPVLVNRTPSTVGFLLLGDLLRWGRLLQGLLSDFINVLVFEGSLAIGGHSDLGVGVVLENHFDL